MNAIPADGVGRLLFFVEDRLAQLRWTREDLAAAGGPAPSTLYKAAERGGGLSVKTLARLDVALGWQEGSAQWTLAGGSPTLRISEQSAGVRLRSTRLGVTPNRSGWRVLRPS